MDIQYSIQHLITIARGHMPRSAFTWLIGLLWAVIVTVSLIAYQYYTLYYSDTSETYEYTSAQEGGTILNKQLLESAIKKYQ